jgi:hypothetical protein
MAQPGSPDPLDIEDEPTDEAIHSRADGRPPEEATSDDPERQAKVILEESEERTEERSRESE